MHETYARQYRSLWEKHWWWRARHDYVMRWCRRLAGRWELPEILDVGCGDGLLFDELARLGSVWGVEPDGRLLSDAGPWRQRIENVPFDADYQTRRRYDLVLMLDVLEHIEDDAAALRRTRSLLQPGGLVLLTVPALPLLWSRHDVANQHYRRYTRAGVSKLLQATGFSVWKLEYFFCWPVGPMYVRRVLAPGRVREQSEGDSYAVRIPPRLLNAAMFRLCKIEQAVGRLVPFPLGSSCLAIASRAL